MSDFLQFIASPDFHSLLAVIVGMFFAGVPIVWIIAFRMGRRFERQQVLNRIHRHLDR